MTSSAEGQPKARWLEMRHSIRNRLITGMIVLVPIGVTLLVMRWLLQWMAGFLQPFVEGLTVRLTTALDIGHISPHLFRVPLMAVSIVGFLLAVYFTGTLAQAVVGRRLILAGETVLMRIPLASTIYSAAKQVMEAIAMPTRSALRTAVLVEFPRREAWSIGFITGRLAEAGEQSLLKVFVPTAPNPTTGFFLMVPHKDVVMTDMTIEEAFKMVISGGIVSPAIMKRRPFPEGAGGEEMNTDA